MTFTLDDNVNIVNRRDICFGNFLNFDVVSCYLKYGLMPPPGSKGFVVGESIPNYSFLNINRENKSNYDDVLHVLKNNCKQIVQQAKSADRFIVLMLSSGIDSRLLYNIIVDIADKEDFLDKFFNVTGDIPGWRQRYSEAHKLKANWKINPVNYSTVEINFSELESEIRVCNLINNRPINGLVSVLLKKVLLYVSRNWVNPIVISGIGEALFFSTGGADFLEKYSNHNTEVEHQLYASDSSVLASSNYLTDKSNNAALNHFKNLKEHKVFEWTNLLERFIHRQQFFSDAPKSNWEFSSYANHFNLEMRHPYIGSKLLNVLLNLPEALLYDGTSKSAIRKLLENIEGEQAKDGIKITSPQREILATTYRDRAFELIQSSVLVDIGIVKKDLMVKEFDNYIDDFNRLKGTDEFSNFNSYSIWRFISTELWIRAITGVS